MAIRNLEGIRTLISVPRISRISAVSVLEEIRTPIHTAIDYLKRAGYKVRKIS